MPSDLDDMNVPGNGEHGGEEVSVVRAGDGPAWLEPASFSKLHPRMLEHARELMHMVGQRRQIAADIDELVIHMRSEGASWVTIGWCVGTTSEAARQRWGDRA